MDVAKRMTETEALREEMIDVKAENYVLRDEVERLEAENAELATNLQLALAANRLMQQERTFPHDLTAPIGDTAH